MPRPTPNHAIQSHVDAVFFQATAEFAGELCLRGLQATTDALDLAVQDSTKKTQTIIGDTDKSLEERSKLLHHENKREAFFKQFGPAQHLAASTILAYATLDTVLAEAVRLLTVHSGTAAPTQNRRGASLKANLPHLQNALPDLAPLNPRDQEVLDQFSKIRNILIHQGYFVSDSDPHVAALKASEDHGDYFELNTGFPILLRDYGVRHFVTICNQLILNVAEAVYSRLLSSPPHP
jgi:hypothetical protein